MAWRKIIVDGVKYRWRAGRSDFVVQRDGKRVGTAPMCEANGTDGYTFERGQWKRTTDGMVTPRDIAQWIRKQSAPVA